MDQLNKPSKPDAIRPDHYGGDSNPFEPIKIINHYKLGFYIGNVLKYILRAGRKDPAKYVEDLKKAKQYIDFEISLHEVKEVVATAECTDDELLLASLKSGVRYTVKSRLRVEPNEQATEWKDLGLDLDRFDAVLEKRRLSTLNPHSIFAIAYVWEK